MNGKIERAAGYTRVSTEEQVKHGWNAGEDRRLILERYADAVIFDDPGRQGDDPNRPGLLALLSRLSEFDVVIIRQQDRISRDPVIWGTCEAAFRKAKVRVETFTGTIDLDTPQGRFHADLMAAVGKLEKGQIGQRVRQQKVARRKAGKPPGGKTPYGYRYADGLLAVDPIEKAVVVRMFQLADAGTSQRQISRILNAEGIPASKGGPWAPSTVSRILGSPLYVGKLRHRINGSDGYCWELHEGQHEAILECRGDDQPCSCLWHRVNRSRATPERRAGGRPALTGHLMTRGLLRDGECGSAWFPVASYNGRPEVYRCIGRRDHGPSYCQMPAMRRDVIDGALRAELTNRYLDWDGARDRLRAQIASEVPMAQAAVEDAVAELQRAESRIAKVTRGWQDEVLSDDEYERQRADLNAERDAAQAALEQAERRLEQIEARGLTTDAEEALLRHLADLKALWSGTVEQAPNIEAQRTVIRQLFERVLLLPADHPWLAQVAIMRESGTPVEGGYFLVPVLREEAILALDDSCTPTIRKVTPVPIGEELAHPTCRTGHFSDALFAPIPVVL